MKEIKVVELFAGVGGFRLGLENASIGENKGTSKFKIVWSNQWEPSTNVQHASDIYVKNFGDEGHSNEDISNIKVDEIPDHNMLVGGFPCQDYSVARTLSKASGLQGKKGVLWWEIFRIIEKKKKKPDFIFLENVDRLLKSPVDQRGRDFAIMLASLSDLGYFVEWRVINAADYGMPQRRRRVFILAYHSSTKIGKSISALKNPFDWIIQDGTIAKSFPVSVISKPFTKSFEINGSLADILEDFNLSARKVKSPFLNTGVVVGKDVYTLNSDPLFDGTRKTLGDITLTNGRVPPDFYVDEGSLDRWRYLKGAKNEKRTNKTSGFEYRYNEGSMVFPDPLDRPSRTIVTGEGGTSPSRFKHVIETKEGRLRRLTPVELERLNGFPDNHTDGAADTKRAFFMGNALVVDIVRKIGESLLERA